MIALNTKTVAGLIAATISLSPSVTLANDQTLIADDSSEISCQIAKKGVTRISLKDDRFASVMKMTAGTPLDDFKVVEEPTRGDIYISLPASYRKPTVSFFGTSAKGNVYKFLCTTIEREVHQVFVENKTMEDERLAAKGQPFVLEEQAAMLVEAMHSNAPIEGYEIRKLTAKKTRIGDLRVKMLNEYRGSYLRGRTLDIENQGKTDLVLDESKIAPPGAVAVSVWDKALPPGKSTTAYIVMPGDVR
tara:strand:- start:55869 stop:56609 length:741 start_codon:yes stop_codon:yes gene_type:complete